MSNNNNSNKTYRLRTNIGEDNVLKVKLDQEYDLLEVLSLSISQKNSYKLHTSDYGVIVGRVLANGGFGIPNVKVSVFIQLTNEDAQDPIKMGLYPYFTTSSKDSKGIRYNLLPSENIESCHKAVGTFPSKRYVLDNEDILEVYDDYYKYTTRTNKAGDYMIFGVPVGNQTVHVDMDMSDIGILSQRPRDLIYKGYNINQFENPNQFKKDTNLDSLAQLYSQTSMVYVYPFWGETDENEIAISRNDVQIQYVFEPTCVFMGSVVSDNTSNAIGKKCVPTENTGAMDELMAGEGTIEMIRKTLDDRVEEIQIQGSRLINGNGVWCYQIPMNLDYMKTDEYGNMVPTDDPTKGIATRTEVRFRISIDDDGGEHTNTFRGKMLVPNNPKIKEEVDYVFGSATKDTSFRDLFWNNVYSVKSFIPRIQKGNSDRNKRFTGIKHTNIYGANNPIPYNNIRIQMPLMYSLLCLIIKFIIIAIKFVNWIVSLVLCDEFSDGCWFDLWIFKFPFWKDRKCIMIPEGFCEEMEGWYYTPGCTQRWGGGRVGFRKLFEDLTEDMSDDRYGDKANNSAVIDPKSIDEKNKNYGDNNVCLTVETEYMMECVEIQLAQEYKVINFDFYNDWLNGTIYLPQWFKNIRKKRSYLFGLIRINPATQACTTSNFGDYRRMAQQCSLSYKPTRVGTVKGKEYKYYTTLADDQDWGCHGRKELCHKHWGREGVLVFGPNGGIIKEEETLKKQKVYYYRPVEWDDSNRRITLFATDIILLGSLNSCDLDGIPQAFKYLTGSSYQMPTNLALTNMDDVGYLFASGTEGTRCTGQKENKGPDDEKYKESVFVTPMDQANSSYRKYSENTSGGSNDRLNGKDSYNGNEKLMTELSGIDWGYTGPDQGFALDDDNEAYLPGGHFLGISCTNSQTNIKSCVNLSRVCELGTWMSQRQEIPKRVNALGVAETVKIVPNGIISKDELSDTEVRSMFATLNHNNLKTIIDVETNRKKYDFEYFYTSNFNGELNKYLNDRKTFSQDYAPYRSDKNFEYNESFKINDGRNRYVLEETDEQYYRFRMGDSNNFVWKWNNNNVAMPMYENSFYFYFGLKDGQTALDEFNKQYFATCDIEEGEPFGIIANQKSGDVCETKLGEVDVELKSINLPCVLTLTSDEVDKGKLINLLEKYDNILERKGGCGTYKSWNCESFKLINLSNKLYKLTIEDGNGFIKSIDISLVLSPPAVQMEIVDFNNIIPKNSDPSDIRDKVYDNPQEWGGYLLLNSVLNNGTTIETLGDLNKLFGILIQYDKNGNPKAYACNSINTNIPMSEIWKVFPNLENVSFISSLYKPFWDDEEGSFMIPTWGSNMTYELCLFNVCNNTLKMPSYRNKFEVAGPTVLEMAANDMSITNELLSKGFDTGFFSGNLKGWDKISDHSMYNWDYDVELYDSNMSTEPDEPFRTNRKSLIYAMKKNFWVNKVIPSNSLTIKCKGGTSPYENILYYQKEVGEVPSEVAISKNNGNLLFIKPTLVSKDIKDYDIPNTKVSGSYRHSTYSNGNQYGLKIPYYFAAKDVKNSFVPEGIRFTDNINDTNTISKWFGVHYIYKPFISNVNIWKSNDEGYYNFNKSGKTKFNRGYVSGNLYNGISNEGYMGICFIMDGSSSYDDSNPGFIRVSTDPTQIDDNPETKRLISFRDDLSVVGDYNSYKMSFSESDYPNVKNKIYQPSTIEIVLDSATAIDNTDNIEVFNNCNKREYGVKVKNPATNIEYSLIEINNEKLPYPFLDGKINEKLFDEKITKEILKENSLYSDVNGTFTGKYELGKEINCYLVATTNDNEGNYVRKLYSPYNFSLIEVVLTSEVVSGKNSINGSIKSNTLHNPYIKNYTSDTNWILTINDRNSGTKTFYGEGFNISDNLITFNYRGDDVTDTDINNLIDKSKLKTFIINDVRGVSHDTSISALSLRCNKIFSYIKPAGGDYVFDVIAYGGSEEWKIVSAQICYNTTICSSLTTFPPVGGKGKSICSISVGRNSAIDDIIYFKRLRVVFAHTSDENIQIENVMWQLPVDEFKLAIEPSELNFVATGGTQSINIQSNTQWVIEPAYNSNFTYTIGGNGRPAGSKPLNITAPNSRYPYPISETWRIKTFIPDELTGMYSPIVVSLTLNQEKGGVITYKLYIESDVAGKIPQNGGTANLSGYCIAFLNGIEDGGKITAYPSYNYTPADEPGFSWDTQSRIRASRNEEGERSVTAFGNYSIGGSMVTSDGLEIIQEGSPFSVTFSPKSIDSPQAGSSQTVKVTCLGGSLSWTLDAITFNGATISAHSGTGVSNLNVNIPFNDGVGPKTGEVILMHNDNTASKGRLKINQIGNPFILLSTNLVNMAASGGSTNIALRANVKWDAQKYDGGEVSISPTSGLGDGVNKTITFGYPNNKSTNAKSSVVHFTTTEVSGLESICTVNQDAGIHYPRTARRDPDVLNFESSGGSFQLWKENTIYTFDNWNNVAEEKEYASESQVVYRGGFNMGYVSGNDFIVNENHSRYNSVCTVKYDVNITSLEILSATLKINQNAFSGWRNINNVKIGFYDFSSPGGSALPYTLHINNVDYQSHRGLDFTRQSQNDYNLYEKISTTFYGQTISPPATETAENFFGLSNCLLFVVPGENITSAGWGVNFQTLMGGYDVTSKIRVEYKSGLNLIYYCFDVDRRIQDGIELEIKLLMNNPS